ncbi:hypothetical protein DYBT9623_04527 [Dyadobacter sp. CECT 9623]|jgi:DNA-binding response OmpR family regulator|uniref:Response regulatory domain-containing protein n=1 Tax=Dyadobacter linearis TaxID=2823330 RepID=A0ABM8UVZ8_9BACT|nr:response regulator [Dyadobacter sp. CECT 9623]CAG5072996.1 hypothetical protein DYBT9623_04527 [Dyadobacter sp. CECT 9623]
MSNKGLFVMIDDDTDDHEIFKMALDDLGRSVDCLFFSDCESAIRYFSKPAASTPGYVFIDLSLPRIAGDRCLQELQKLKEFDHPCIVVYSTSIPKEWQSRLSNLGVDKFIEKTFSVPTLVDEIRHLTEAD